MSRRYKKIQPKLKPLPFIIIGAVLITFVLLLVFLRDTPQQKFAKQYNSAGAEVASDHVFKEISFKTFEKKISNKEKFIIYLGYPSCGPCVEEVKYYDLEFKDKKLEDSLKNIYYLNVQKLTPTQHEKLMVTYGIDVQTVPHLYYYEKGTIKISRDDEVFIEIGSKAPGQIKAFYEAVKVRQ